MGMLESLLLMNGNFVYFFDDWNLIFCFRISYSILYEHRIANKEIFCVCVIILVVICKE